MLANQVAVVTGATSGIGQAIALALAAQAVELCLVGRNSSALERVALVAQAKAPQVHRYRVDLSVDQDIKLLEDALRRDVGRVDILVHSAGAYARGPFQEASMEDLDTLYRANVRAPYQLTQGLLPMLVSSQGQIVFINSSVIQHSGANVGQFAATQHALKSLADSLRAEVSAVRVLSVFPGRTATPRQARIHAMEAKPYHPERLLQPEDVAATVIQALGLPRSAEVCDIYLRPLAKPLQ
jgi:short-subunit dehydrogenase